MIATLWLNYKKNVWFVEEKLQLLLRSNQTGRNVAFTSAATALVILQPLYIILFFYCWHFWKGSSKEH